MSGRVKLIYVAVFIACTAAGSSVSGQVWQPAAPVNYVHDLQPFKTFDIRNFESSPDPNEGFFFSYERLWWNVSGERTPVGDPSVTGVVSIDFYPGLPNPPTPILNGLLNAPPRATFAWGHRYEAGYINGHHGWSLGVIDSPRYNSNAEYGFGPVPNPARPQGINTGVGSVAILFFIPPEFTGLLDGFTDVFDFTQSDFVLGGPEGGVLNAQDGIIDGFVTFIPTFQQVGVRNLMTTDSVELMKTYRFDQTKHGATVQFQFGARWMRMNDKFRVDAIGGTLGDSFWDTRVDNQIIGPQVALSWQKQQGRWSTYLEGRALLGANFQNLSQEGGIGSELNPGAANRPVYFNPTVFTHGRQEQAFSPVVEMRVSTSYQLTKAFSLQLGWTGIFADNIRRAAPHVQYSLPNMGLRDAGDQEIFINGLTFGCELNH